MNSAARWIDGGDLGELVDAEPNRDALRYLAEHEPSCHSDTGDALMRAAEKCGDCVAYSPSFRRCRYVALLTNRRIFALGLGQRSVCYRLPEKLYTIALRTGAVAAEDIGAGWVCFELFRPGWPAADLPFWTLAAYRAARDSLQPTQRTAGMDGVEIRSGYVPGAIGRVVELHGTYYHAHWGFGAFFEAKVARELAEFFGRYDARRDSFWTAAVSGRVEGSITIDGAHVADDGAHLRWFILSDALRGKGAGKELLRAAIDFCRGKRYPRVYLWTFEGLHAARHLYERAGFGLVEQHRGTQWGREVTEQRFELRLTERA